MSKIKITTIILGSLLGVVILVSCVNILQNGFGPKNIAPEKIIGKALAETTADDVLKLSKSDFVQLFYSLPAPSLDELKGEYRAANLPAGVMAASVQFYTDHFFGPGHWTGKAFRPVKEGSGEGYNIFTSGEKNAPVVKRTRKIDTHVGKSAFDEKDSYHLVYRKYNSFPVDSMCDELRRLNDKLYVGLGYMDAGGGSINPSPFIVYGSPQPFKGAD